jgi:hypothetical protein
MITVELTACSILIYLFRTVLNLKNMESEKQVKTIKDYWNSLTESEKIYQKATIERLQKMRDTREKRYKEWNNLTYSENYDFNREADLAFTDMEVLVNKNNNGDSITSEFQMTTGATRTKDKSLISHLMAFNFEADIIAYDKDNKIVTDLGEATEDMIHRSLEVEDWDAKKIDMITEFVAQGNVFMREVYMKYPTKIHDNGNWKVGMPITDYKEDGNSITKWTNICERQFIPGKNVFLGDITQRNIQKQTIVAVYQELPESVAKQIFGKWDRWDYVKATIGKVCSDKIASIIKQDANFMHGVWWSEDYWNIQKPVDDVGILHVYDNVKKTYQIFANGVMMLPVGYSLYEISPSGKIPMAKGDAEVMTWFAYSKGIPANTLIDTRMYDQVYNSVVQKMLQSAKPTMGNNTGRLIPSWLLYSSRLIQGLRANMLEPLLPAESRTITNSDTAFIEIVKGIINDKSVDDAFSGEPIGVKTATEMLERKKNTIMKLFALVEGMIEFEEQMSKLRISSIFSKWTVPEESPYFEEQENIVDGVKSVIKVPKTRKGYKKEIIPTQFKETGKEWFRDVRFRSHEEKLPDVYDMAKEEDEMEKKLGKPVRISLLEVESLSRLFDWTWKVEVRAKQDEDSKLERMTYLDNKQRIANLFGVEVLNKEYTLQKIAQMDSEDPEKAYNAQQTPALPPEWGNPQNPLSGVMANAAADWLITA